jgi:integrase/recombinase XerD
MAKRNAGEVVPVYILWVWSANEKGQHPVRLRISYQQKRRYYPVLTPDRKKVFLSQKEFDFVTSTNKAKLRNESRALRDALDGEVDKANDAISEATLKGKKPFSIGEFEKKYLGADANRNFLSHFKGHIDKLARKGQAGTVRAYSSAYSAFYAFQNGKDFDPADLTPKKLEAFDEWLRTPRQNKKGLNDTSVCIYMRCIRSVYNEMAANDEYLMAIYPFSRRDTDDTKYKIPKGGGQKGVTLTKEEMRAFIDGKVNGEAIPENPMYRAKQLFLFSFFGQGTNFKDLALLKYENVGKDNVEFERQKTIRTKQGRSKVQITLTDELTEILIEQGNPNKKKSNYIFEVFEANKIYTPKQIDDTIRQWVKVTNKWLKRYCALNELPEVSTYAARHTFASISKSHLSLAMISKMLGHSRVTTTQTYLGRFDHEENKTGLQKVFGAIKEKQA